MLVSGLVLGSLLSAAGAHADVLYELSARTADALTRGTVELEETVSVSVKGDRMRQEVRGTRTVLTRRGARYAKPGHRVTLDQADRGVRYEINLDAGTYREESFASLRRQQEEIVTAAELALRVNPAESPPNLAVIVERTGERQRVHGRECERVVLKSTREVVLAATRGAGSTGSAPVRFMMTFDLCLAPDVSGLREARGLERRIEEQTGGRGALADRQLRTFAARRDTLAVFELMQRVMEREQEKLRGVPVRWERLFVGPRREQPEATLFRHVVELTRVDEGVLEPASFDLPGGLQLDARGGGPSGSGESQ
jgi:hypothetical protein